MVYVNKWFHSAVFYRWKSLEAGYTSRFLEKPIAIHYVSATPEIPVKYRKKPNALPLTRSDKRARKSNENEADEKTISLQSQAPPASLSSSPSSLSPPSNQTAVATVSTETDPVSSVPTEVNKDEKEKEKKSPIVVHQDKNTAEKHSYLLTHGCLVSESPFSRPRSSEQELIIATAGPIPSCIDILHGNVLMGSTNGHVLEFEMNSEAEAKEEWKVCVSLFL